MKESLIGLLRSPWGRTVRRYEAGGVSDHREGKCRGLACQVPDVYARTPSCTIAAVCTACEMTDFLQGFIPS